MLYSKKVSINYWDNQRFSIAGIMNVMKKFLGVFDFDNTIIDDNSDLVIRNMLSKNEIPDEINKLANNGKWTAHMREIFSLLHHKRIPEEMIRKVITGIPPVPYFLLFFKNLKEMDSDIIIISDSNTYFIDEWLKCNGIRGCVDAIYSNPSAFIDGKLSIMEYHLQDWCNLSEINLCKGHVLEQHIENQKKLGILYNYVFYVGDGRNDLCPTLKLENKDFVFPRIGYPLLDKISSREDIKALVTPWNTTNDILNILKTLYT